MRAYTQIAVLMLALPTAGCSSAAAPTPSGTSQAAAPSHTAPTARPSGVPASRPAGGKVPAPTGPPAGGQPHDATSSPATGNGADPENPRDQVGAPVVLTGTVSRHGGCVILDTGARRWALLGAKAATLTDGQRTTVRGRPAAVPSGCNAAFGLTVRSVI